MLDQLRIEDPREFAKHHPRQALEHCLEVHPSDAAEFLSRLDEEDIWPLLSQVEPAQARSKIFAHLEEGLQADLAETLSRDELTKLVVEMSSDDRVDLLKRIPEDRRDLVLPALAWAEREDIRRLSAYEEGTAGSVMSSDYCTLSPQFTAEEAINRLRLEAPNKETIYYAYVVDEQRRLIGFVSLRDLILARAGTRIEEIMNRETIFARVSDDQEKAARQIQKYDFIALPVVNEQDVLVGIITHDDALDIITQEQTEDLEKLMAIRGSHEPRAYLRTPVSAHFKNRVVWVMILAMFGLISGYIIHSFEDVLMQFAILATFIPMLADTGGNTGSQAATLVVRALAIQEITAGDILKVLWKELRVAIPIGVVLSIIAFGRVLFFAGSSQGIAEGFSAFDVGLAVSVALGLQVVSSTLLGAMLPLGAARLKLDPAVVASPALTTAVDITGLLIYFTTVKIMLGI